MILYLDSSINKSVAHFFTADAEQCAELFSDYSLDSKDDVLSLVDLRADDAFQRLIAPKQLVDLLCKHDFSEKIKTIELMVSDISTRFPLAAYAQELANAFQLKGYTVQISAPMMPGGMTFITPPTPGSDQWSVYFLKTTDFDLLMQAAPAYDPIKDDDEDDELLRYQYFQKCLDEREPVFKGELSALRAYLQARRYSHAEASEPPLGDGEENTFNPAH